MKKKEGVGTHKPRGVELKKLHISKQGEEDLALDMDIIHDACGKSVDDCVCEDATIKPVGDKVDVIIMDEADVCPDCHGGFNSLGNHLDCRTCNSTGVK